MIAVIARRSVKRLCVGAEAILCMNGGRLLQRAAHKPARCFAMTKQGLSAVFMTVSIQFYAYKVSIKEGSFLKENQTKKYDFQTFLFLKDFGVAPVTRLK